MKHILLVTALAVLAANPALAYQGKGSGKFMRFFDANQDGVVTMDEFDQSARQRFKRIDADNSGQISTEEFRSYIKQRRAERKAAKFKRIDTDNDGQVSKEEFIAYQMKKAQRKFTYLDRDNDGHLSVEEITRHHRGHKRSHRKHIFHKLDANGDGNITGQESYTAWLNWFKRIDANADQSVTEDEVKAYRAKKWQQRHSRDK